MSLARSRVRTLLRWAPRILGLLFAAFLSLFAFDVFDGTRGFLEALGGFLVHLGPTWLVLAATAAGWKWPRAGAAAFATLGVAYIVWMWGEFPWITYATISGPAFVVAALFLADGLRGRKADD